MIEPEDGYPWAFTAVLYPSFYYEEAEKLLIAPFQESRSNYNCYRNPLMPQKYSPPKNMRTFFTIWAGQFISVLGSG